MIDLKTAEENGYCVHSLKMEQYREYVFADQLTYRIYDPWTLYISPSGSHRVVDSKGLVHHISSWRAIRWLPVDSSDPVQF